MSSIWIWFLIMILGLPEKEAHTRLQLQTLTTCSGWCLLFDEFVLAMFLLFDEFRVKHEDGELINGPVNGLTKSYIL